MNQTVNIDVQVQTKSLNDLENELSQINEELKSVEIGSQAFKDLSKDAQALTKQLDKANQAAEGFTDDKKFLAADGAIKTMGGSLSGVVGTLGLLGVESESFGEMEKKAASAIAVAMGVKDVSEGIKQMADANVLAAAKAKIMGITTKQALIATGIGAFVVVLGSMVAYWDDIVKGVKKFGESVPFVGKAIKALEDGINSMIEAFRPVLEWLGILPDEAERANAAVIASNETLINSGERELALLQARGASAEEIFKKREEMLKAELDNLKRTDADKQEIYEKETELQVLRAAEEKRLLDEKQAKQDEANAKWKEAQDKKADEQKGLDDEAKKKEEDRLNSLLSLQESYYEKERDLAAVNEQQKITLEETRALEELERLGGTLEQRNMVIAYYDQLRDQARKDEETKQKEDTDKKNEEDLKAAEELEQKKLDLKLNSLQTLSELFGQETALGKAALVAKQAILAQELIGEVKGLSFKAKNAATEATIDGAKASSSIAVGAAETAKVGFPWNIPLIIGYAAQAAGIISAVKGAVANVKGASANISVPSVSVSQPRTQTTIQPDQLQSLTATNQNTVRAYVIGGDVRSNNEADAKIQNRRTIDY